MAATPPTARRRRCWRATTSSADGREWRLTLRPGLTWHDGHPVLARDCVASIRRWAKRDALGGALMRATDELSAPDDTTIRFRLNKPFPLLRDALGKPAAYMPAMMPERLASHRRDGKQVTEMVGSGPFRFLADERVAGSHNAYAKFEGYKPREGGTTNWYSGPKVVHYDRVVWTTMPDAATAASALQAGEQDWWETATPDLLPLLRRNKAITVEVMDPSGAIGMMRPNHLQPPFNNPAIRRALLLAVDQTAEMQAVVGDDPSQYTVPCGVFTPGHPDGQRRRAPVLPGPRDIAAATAALKAAGYGGERVVLIVPTDYQHMQLIGEVLADTMRRIGMTVDYVVDRLGHHAAAPHQQGPGGQGRLERVHHLVDRQRLAEPGHPPVAAWQRRGGLPRLVHQRPHGAADRAVVRRSRPRAPARRSAATSRSRAWRTCPSTRSGSSRRRPPTEGSPAC